MGSWDWDLAGATHSAQDEQLLFPDLNIYWLLTSSLLYSHPFGSNQVSSPFLNPNTHNIAHHPSSTVKIEALPPCFHHYDDFQRTLSLRPAGMDYQT